MLSAGETRVGRLVQNQRPMTLVRSNKQTAQGLGCVALMHCRRHKAKGWGVCWHHAAAPKLMPIKQYIGPCNEVRISKAIEAWQTCGLANKTDAVKDRWTFCPGVGSGGESNPYTCWKLLPGNKCVS